MKKNEFLSELRRLLAGLEDSDRDGWLEYYSELIDDRMEEGLDEVAAVAAVGTPSAAAQAILKEVPLSRLVKARVKPRRRLTAVEIVLLVVGSPIWLTLLVAAFAVGLSLYVTLWAVMLSLWAVDLALGAGALAALAPAVLWLIDGNLGFGIAYIGAALLLSGLSVFLFFGCLALTRLLCVGSKRAVVGIKMALVGKGKEKAL